MNHRRIVPAAVILAALAIPGAAAAQAGGQYPEPSNPGKVAPKPKGPFETFTVCPTARRGCDHTRIQAAIDAAGAGDKIVVKPGTYRQGVRIKGARKSYLRLVGSPKSPKRVVLDGRGLKGGAGQNAFLIDDGADEVSVSGFLARNYKANGFFVRNVTGYTLRDLVAVKTGAYGLYAFNSRGGEMTDSEAYYQNDAGFYVGQTPEQSRPVRTIVRNVSAWGNVLGFSGTNMRYVTITGSRFYNNGTGIAPNGLDTEKYPPDEDNVIAGNDIFWNNFDYWRGAPFPLKKTGAAALLPVGSGILLLSGRRNVIENNRIHGNYLLGVGMVESILVKDKANSALRGNVVRNNQFGLGGADRNGRDLGYDGNGTANCFAGNTGVLVTLPADASTLAGCPFAGANAFSPAVQGEAYGFIGDTQGRFWIKHPHAAKPGYTPLEVYKP